MGMGTCARAWSSRSAASPLGSAPASLECAARFAFGGKGRPAVRAGDRDLPPDTDVKFEVELLELGTALPLASLNTEQRVEEAQRKREIGNNLFAYRDYAKSTQCYGAALKALDGLTADMLHEDSSKVVATVKLMIDCGNNIAAAHLKLRDYKKAESACVAVLEIDGDNIKALHRAGIAARMQDKFKESHLAFGKLLSLDPGNRAAEREFLALRRREKEYNAKEANMMKQMGALMLDKQSNREGAGATKTDEKEPGTECDEGKAVEVGEVDVTDYSIEASGALWSRSRLLAIALFCLCLVVVVLVAVVLVVIGDQRRKQGHFVPMSSRSRGAGVGNDEF